MFILQIHLLDTHTHTDVKTHNIDVVCVSVAQSCLTLCNPMHCGCPGFSVHGILQARILEWVAIPVSRGSSQPAIEPRTPALQAESLPSESPGQPRNCIHTCRDMHGSKYAKYVSTYPDQTN